MGDSKMKYKLFWAWFDFWIGFYFDRKKRILYICPLPTIVLAISFSNIEIPTKEYEKETYWMPVCEKCGEKVDKITSLMDLAVNGIGIPYEWYKEKNLIEKWNIYVCRKCFIIFRERKLLKYYFNIIKGWIK